MRTEKQIAAGEKLLRALDELQAGWEKAPDAFVKLTEDGHFQWYYPVILVDDPILPEEINCGTRGCALGVMAMIGLVPVPKRNTDSAKIFDYRTGVPQVAKVLGIPEIAVNNIFYNSGGYWKGYHNSAEEEVSPGDIANALREEFYKESGNA